MDCDWLLAYHLSRLQYFSRLSYFGKIWLLRFICDVSATPSGIKREWYVYTVALNLI
jgi:hypothetical protein